VATGVPTAPTGTTVPLCPLGLGADILSRLRSHVGASEPEPEKQRGCESVRRRGPTRSSALT
jgi:hypothetical protein